MIEHRQGIDDSVIQKTVSKVIEQALRRPPSRCSGKFILLFALGAIGLTTGPVAARDQIQISGSSTVFPYAKIVAETFNEVYPNYKIPVIESGGTGAGIKEFCRGVGENTIDIANASRPITANELHSCIAAGVNDIEEVKFGYDGIVFAGDIHGPDWHLTPTIIYRALAAQTVIDNKLRENSVANWNEVDQSLVDWPIVAYIPGEKHGTREVFEEKLMLAGCRDSGAAAKMAEMGLKEQEITAHCIAIRKDGAAVDIDGDYSETLARIEADKQSVGVFGLDYYQNNADRLKVASVSNVIPTAQTVANGSYPVSRPLYFYVKKAHIGVVAGLQQYVDFFLNEQMIGPDSPLVDYGLVAAPATERAEQRASFAEGKIMGRVE